MTRIIELHLNQRPPSSERYVLVLGSHLAPARAMDFVDHWRGRTYFATDSAASVADVVRKATIWADTEHIANVYVQRAS
jgi:hypothetical protein